MKNTFSPFRRALSSTRRTHKLIHHYGDGPHSTNQRQQGTGVRRLPGVPAPAPSLCAPQAQGERLALGHRPRRSPRVGGLRVRLWVIIIDR